VTVRRTKSRFYARPGLADGNQRSASDRLTLSREALRHHYRWARDYGKTRGIRVTLGEDQLERLQASSPWVPVSEHVRRAVDVYLEAMR
jgi:hypothetical protein